MAKDFIVRLKCPYGDQDSTLVLQDREETLIQLLETPFDFECPVHGVQREFPIEASEKRLSSAPSRRWKESTPGSGVARQPRSSKRISLHVPVLVYGWSRDEIPFHEETSTLLVNASGGLLALATKVSLGSTIFIVNKVAQEEQECRVVYLGSELKGKTSVGVAFKHPAAGFWRIDHQEPRLSKAFGAWVRGLHRNRHGFAQSAYAVGRPFSNLSLAGWMVLGLVIGGTVLWLVMHPVGTSPQVSRTQPAELGPPAQAANEPSASGGLVAVQELDKPWSSKTFDFRERLTRKSIPSIVIRLPGGAPGKLASYWAFSLQEPFGRCQLEYITDLRRLSADYGYKANHPMVGDPCSLTVFDPLQMTDIPGGAWVHGAVVKGYAIRPPLVIEIRMEGDQLVAVQAER